MQWTLFPPKDYCLLLYHIPNKQYELLFPKGKIYLNIFSVNVSVTLSSRCYITFLENYTSNYKYLYEKVGNKIRDNQTIWLKSTRIMLSPLCL